MRRSLDSYNHPYPDRDNPGIQSIVNSKKEFNELAPTARQAGEIRINPKFFNSQILFQRMLYVWRSMLLFWRPGTGKTGAYECFRDDIVTNHSGEITTFYYVAAETQINEFETQISTDFASKEIKDRFRAIKGTNSKQIQANQKTLLREVMKSAGYVTLTYDKLSTTIEALNNEEVIEVFGNGAIFIDEIQFIKLDESKDLRGKKGTIRKRRRIYQNIWRMVQLCPNCVVILGTGTPMTNVVAELIYHINLMPNTKQIRTPLSEQIAASMQEQYGIVTKKNQWADVDLSDINSLEKVLRGRVTYLREPDTGAVETYHLPNDPAINWKEVYYDEDLSRTVTSVNMSHFQSRAYIKAQEGLPRIKKNISEGDKVYAQSLQACVFAFPTEAYARYQLYGTEKPAQDKESAVGRLGLDITTKKKTVKTPKQYATWRHEKKLEAEGKLSKKFDSINIREPHHWFKQYLEQDNLLLRSGAKVYDVVSMCMDPKMGPIYLASLFNNATCGVIGWALDVRLFSKFEPRDQESQWIKSDKEEEEGILEIRPAPRYAIISSKNKPLHQQILRLLYHSANVRGIYLKLVMVTKVGTVGLNIKNAEQVCILEPGFTPANLDQTVKRAFRPTSHIKSIQWAMKHRNEDFFNVYINYYVAELAAGMSLDGDSNDSPSSSPSSETDVEGKRDPTIDWQLYRAIRRKDEDIAIVMRFVKRIAVDTGINAPRNIRPTDVKDSPICDYQICDYKPYKMDPTWPLDYSTYDSYFLNKSLTQVGNLLSQAMLIYPEVSLEMLIRQAGPEYSQIEIINGLRYLIENKIALGTDPIGYTLYLFEQGGVFYSHRDRHDLLDRSLGYYSKINVFNQEANLEQVMLDYISPDQLVKYQKAIETSNDFLTFCANISMPYRIKLFEEGILNSDNVWASRMIKAMRNLYTQLEDKGVVVTVHQIESLYSRGTNYNGVDSVLKPVKQLRILDSENVWRNCNQVEVRIYAKMLSNKLEGKLTPYYEENEALGFMGIIVRTDMVHIRDIVRDKNNQLEGKGGRKCVNIKKSRLIDMIYNCQGTDSKKKLYDGNERSSTIRKIQKYLPNISKDYLAAMTDSKLKFYLAESEALSSTSGSVLAYRLCKCLANRGAIFALVGKVSTTLELIK